eukprot:TRINITY_DN333_c0_g1_i3.p1 TRINITY_DN333_c0_g1~~TRINITY_DN333_c0_g1_i3.p1  ORF type:complete len:150 (-),score=22.20 TRINITY_DN333_c0_g1_i3:29-478(-)
MLVKDLSFHVTHGEVAVLSVALQPLDTILLGPFLDDTNDVFDLWIVGVSKHANNISQKLLGFMACYYLLEDAHTSTTLAFPIFWIWIEPLQHVEGLGRVVKLSDLGQTKEDRVRDTKCGGLGQVQTMESKEFDQQDRDSSITITLGLWM